MNTSQNRSNKMYLINEDLARAQIRERIEAAQEMKRSRQARLARRARRAEEAAHQARLRLARSMW